MGIGRTIVGIVVLSFGGLCLFASVSGLRSALKYRGLSIVDGSDIGAGELVGVRGTIVDHGRLTSPFTEQDCVGHKWSVERRTQDHDRGRHWQTKRVRGDMHAFSMRADDGTDVTVEPGDDVAPRSDIRIGTEVIDQLKPGADPPPRLQELIADGTIDEQDDSLGSSIDEELGYEDTPLGTRRYRECTLTEGDEIYVYGVADVVGTGVEIGRDETVFAVSDSTDTEIAETQTGQAIMLFFAGLVAALFAIGFLL